MSRTALLTLLAACLCGGMALQRGDAGRAMAAETKAPPWSITYSDGAANAFRFWRDSKRERARFRYTPVRPEQSSTGFYSGGEPKEGRLDGKRVLELWERVEKLAADRKLHTPDRNKGTGAFLVRDAAGEREFIIEDGPLLREFNESLAPYRGRVKPPRAKRK